MPIQSSDIKLRASERMTDTTDGGGRRTLNLIEDGVAGNIFPKVSRVDSVYGRVNLRKVYGHVDTVNKDTYAGAHFIVTDAPDNDRIHITAFSTASEYDNRTAARDRIESYVIAGPESRMTLYGRQLVGAQALLAYQRVEEPLPEIGEVFAVSNETGSVTSAQQFVSVQDVTHEVRTFVDASTNGEFTYRVVTLTIGAPLRYEFTGVASPRRISGSETVTGRIRSTTVADASRYFGIQPLAEAGATSDLTVRVASVYTPIVPTTQRETALSLATISGAAQTIPTTGNIDALPTFYNEFITYSGPTSYYWSYPPGASIYLPGSPASITVDINSTVNTVVPGGSFSAVGRNFTFDGQTLLRTSGDNGYTIYSIRYTPTVEVTQPAHTRAIEVTLATRGTVYTPVLQPLPSPGTLLVDYRALGKWYRLRDDGTGELSGGDSAYGTGTVNYVTGGVIITLGSLPDVGSSVLLSWGSPTHYEIKTTDAGSTAFQDFTLTNLPVKSDSVVCSYVANSVTYTITSNQAGALSGGGATGTLDPVTGAVHIEYGTRLPDFDSTVSVAYLQSEIDPVQPNPPAPGTTLAETYTAASTTSLTFQIPTGFEQRGFSATIVVTATASGFASADTYLSLYGLTDGTLMLEGYDYGYDWYGGGNSRRIGSQIGTVNYSTGLITVTSTSFSEFAGRWSNEALGWAYETRVFTFTGRTGGTNTFRFKPVVVNGIGGSVLTIDTPRTQTFSVETDAPISVDITRTSTSGVVAGSLNFSAAGKRFIDLNGTLYADVSSTTGSGTAAGSINYETGVATLSLWNRGATLALAVQSCLTKFGEWTAIDAFFRTAGSPLRPASLYVQVAADDGTLVTGLADQDGVISGEFMRGEVEQTMGVVRVEFGSMVTAAGNELQTWYKPANVVGANVWKPKAVQPETLRYSSVVVSNLPLNADILGLDPVRLPSDGRVPIYRPADVVVVHNTLSYNAGTPVASAVLNVGRTGLSALWLEDANKLKLPATKYAADLDAGTVTMAADLSLTGYVTPISVKHRIEEMALLSDVQINGQLTLTAPLLRPYPLGSFVSSALLFGDMFSRVTGVFDQNTWTSVWSDSLIGGAATAQYNDVDYPIEVLNSAAVSDRWRVNFTGTNSFQVVSENMGVIATGTTAADLAPINPLTGVPYFTLQSEGWGLGWSVGNQLRFNTVGAVAPIWLARTVLPGATLVGDSFDAQLRGDVD